MEEVPECHVKELGLSSPASRSQIPPEGPVWRVSVDRHRSSHPAVPPAAHTHALVCFTYSLLCTTECEEKVLLPKTYATTSEGTLSQGK